MRYLFNQQAAIWTFVAVVLGFIIAVGISRLGYDQSPSLLGSVIYGILGLFACIITGFLVPKRRIDAELNETGGIKNGKKNRR